jgi:DNA adenine methylase
MEPKDELARFYKLVFVRTHARDCRPDGTHPARNHLGCTTNPEKYLRAAERLKNVTVLKQDYKKTIAQLDGPDTFFFVDPPYPGE